MVMSVMNFKSFFGGWSAQVKAVDETEAREKMVDQLQGNNSPEYISDDTSEIAISDKRYLVCATPLYNGVFSVTIEPAE